MEGHLRSISVEYEKLRSAPPKVITKEIIQEVAPADYESLKERVEHYKHKFHEYKEKCHSFEIRIHESDETVEEYKRVVRKWESQVRSLEI